MERLSQKFSCAVVTGSSSGLGRAFAEHLLGEGIPVVGLSRTPQIQNAPEHYHPWPCDLSQLPDLSVTLDAVFEKFPQLDLVINNAGFGVLEHLQKQSHADVEAQYHVMLGAPTLIAQRALQLFDSRKSGGCLCNVSSLAVELPLPLMPVYNACKGGLSALSQSLILDASGADKNYIVLDFRPGDFNTSFAQRMKGRVSWNGIDLRAVMDRHHSRAPSEALAVKGLHRALLRERSGTVRVGSFFQAALAPLGARILSHRMLRRFIRAYYRN